MPNFAAWNRRSPSHSRVSRSAGTTLTGVTSHWFRNERSPLAAVARTDRLGVVDQAVVLGVEDVVDGGEADVLVDAAVAGHEVRVEQLVVVGQGVLVIADQIIGVGREGDAERSENGLAECAMSARNGWPVRTAIGSVGSIPVVTGAAGLPSGDRRRPYRESRRDPTVTSAESRSVRG